MNIIGNRSNEIDETKVRRQRTRTFTYENDEEIFLENDIMTPTVDAFVYEDLNLKANIKSVAHTELSAKIGEHLKLPVHTVNKDNTSNIEEIPGDQIRNQIHSAEDMLTQTVSSIVNEMIEKTEAQVDQSIYDNIQAEAADNVMPSDGAMGEYMKMKPSISVSDTTQNDSIDQQPAQQQVILNMFSILAISHICISSN